MIILVSTEKKITSFLFVYFYVIKYAIKMKKMRYFVNEIKYSFLCRMFVENANAHFLRKFILNFQSFLIFLS